MSLLLTAMASRGWTNEEIKVLSEQPSRIHFCLQKLPCLSFSTLWNCFLEWHINHESWQFLVAQKMWLEHVIIIFFSEQCVHKIGNTSEFFLTILLQQQLKLEKGFSVPVWLLILSIAPMTTAVVPVSSSDYLLILSFTLAIGWRKTKLCPPVPLRFEHVPLQLCAFGS